MPIAFVPIVPRIDAAPTLGSFAEAHTHFRYHAMFE